MTEIEVIFCKKRGFQPGSKIIMLGEGLPFSHVAYRHSEGMLSEAVYPKSRTILFGEWIWKYEVVKIVKIKLPVQSEEFQEYNKSLDNKSYSFIELGLMTLQKFFIIVGFIIDRMKINGAKALVCTERLGRVLKWAKIYEFETSLDTLTLRELYQIVRTIELIQSKEL